MDWEKYGFVNASFSRKKVLEILAHRPLLPSQISKETEKHLSHISRTLKELEEKGIVKCLTPGRHKGKVYTITEEGKEILKEIFP